MLNELYDNSLCRDQNICFTELIDGSLIIPDQTKTVMQGIEDGIDGRKNIAHLYLDEIDKKLKGENRQIELSLVEETINIQA